MKITVITRVVLEIACVVPEITSVVPGVTSENYSDY